MSTADWIQNLSRADFLKSVGLYVMRDHLILVRMRKDFQRLSLVEQEVREINPGGDGKSGSSLAGWIPEEVRGVVQMEDAGSRREALRGAIHSLLPYFNPSKDPFYICLSPDQAMVSHIFLPQAAEENLAQVVEYEIERYLPFRRDDVYYDFLPAGEKGDKIGLFLFAVPKQRLKDLLEILSDFGIKPNGVETTATALSNYLLFCAGGIAGPVVLFGDHNQAWEMIGLDTKTAGWRRSPQLLFSHWLPRADWIQGPGKEILNNCLSASPRFFSWGEVGDFLFSVKGQTFPHEDLLALGEARLKGGKGLAHPYVLPAVGAALRGVREATLPANLFRKNGGDEGRERLFSRLNTFLALLVLLGLVSWGGSYPIKDEIRLRQLQKENQKLEPAVDGLRREETELQKLRKEVSFLSDLRERRGEILRILDELSRVVPASAYVSNLRYRDGVVEIQGSAENASNLVPVLERSPLFENVAFNAPSNRGRDNRETFSLKAELERTKEKAKKP